MLALVGACTRVSGLAGLPGLVAECTGDPQGPACNALLANRGVALPTSTGQGTWDPGAEGIFVSHDGSVHARDWSGTLGDIEYHRLPGLAGVLPTLESNDGWTDDEHLTMVFGDGGLFYGSIVDLLYTADRNHLAPLTVGVQTEAGPAAMPVGASWTWDPEDTRIRDFACCMRAKLEVDAVELEPCGGELVRASLSDLGPIVRAAEHEPHPNGCVEMKGAAEARWSDAIAVLDAIRSPGCPLVPDRADRDRGCRPIGVVLEHDPPIPWRPGNWDAITVTVGEIELQDSAPRPRDPAIVRKRAEAALPAVTECLRTSEAMRLRRPERILVSLMTDEGREVSMATAGNATQQMPACVPEAFAPLTDRAAHLLPGDAVVFLEIDLPK